MIEKEFIPYEEALALKKIGFDEPCFATIDQTEFVHIKGTEHTIGGAMFYFAIDAPTFSQAFRWLLKHHNLYGVIIPTETMNWTFKTMTVVESIVEVPPYKHVDANDYGTHEEAELSCLKKLIEIVKNG